MPDDAGGSNLKKQNKLIKRILSGFDEDLSTEENIMLMVKDSNEKGIIENSTKNMIENIFEFDDLTAGELMTHRTEITAIESGDSVLKAVELFMETGYSRIPVYEDDVDNISGLLYAKDLLKFVGREITPEIKLTDLLRDAYFVPKSKNCSDLFAELTASKMQMAVVVDEYGGTEGLITMEDLIESIVGSIQDEYDNEEEELKKLSERVFTVDGAAAIDDVSELIGVELDNGDCETIAGLMLERLGDIPKDTDRPSVTVNSVKLTAVKIEDRRIARILIEKI